MIQNLAKLKIVANLGFASNNFNFEKTTVLRMEPTQNRGFGPLCSRNQSSPLSKFVREEFFGKVCQSSSFSKKMVHLIDADNTDIQVLQKISKVFFRQTFFAFGKYRDKRSK